MMTPDTTKQYCELCGKEIPKSGKVYIAGSVCSGHGFWEIIGWKILKKLKILK